jgi:NMD protein affecting ribosome stability and mRNA decay
MLFSGCVQCGRSTTSVEGLCPSCEEIRSIASPRPRARLELRRSRVKQSHRSD